jgi:hypothetical protein
MATSENALIPKVWTTLPDAIRVRLGNEAGPQRAMLEEGHLLIILHQLPSPEDHRRKAALFWRSPDGTWKTTERGSGPGAISDLLEAFADCLDQLDEAENAAQTALAYHSVLEKLAPVVRSTRGLHKALQQAREMMKSERELINCRDRAAAVERSADLLLQDAQFGLDFVVAKQAEAQAAEARQMSAAAHRLNLLAALFLPLTALAGVFGMNSLPAGLETPAVFWLVCIAGLSLGAFLAWELRRR